MRHHPIATKSRDENIVSSLITRFTRTRKCYTAVVFSIILLGLFLSLVESVTPRLHVPTGKYTYNKTIDEQRIPVYIEFKLSRDWKQSNFQWRVVSDLMTEVEESTTVASSTTTKRHTTNRTTRTIISKFTIKQDYDYYLILEGLETDGENTYPRKEMTRTTVTSVANVTISFGSWILASADDLSLHTRTHIISFNTASKWRVSQERRLEEIKEENRPELESPPPRDTVAPVDTPTVGKPPPPTLQAPTPVSIPAPVPAPIPAPVPAPVLAPVVPAPVVPGGTSNVDDSGATTVPTAFTGTKPPSSFAGSSNITVPSFSPTIELPCISSTNGSMIFDDRYIAVKLSLTDYQENDFVSQNDTNTVLINIETAYNTVAVCEQENAFRRVNQAELVRINDIGSSSTEVEWIVRLVGECDGCIESSMSLFTTIGGSVNGTDQNFIDLIPEAALGSKPCVCPGPLISTFQNQFNLLSQNSTGDAILAVVELVNAESCDPLAVQASSPEEHTTLVSLVLSRDPSEMSEIDLDELFIIFTDTVHSRLSLTYPTCDLSRKLILEVKRDPNNPSIGRRLLCGTENENHPPRILQQTSADFELVVQVTFQCFGCEGRLFGATNYTASYDCLCPADTDRFGVEEREILSSLNDVLAQLSIDQSVSDVIEIVAVPCSSGENIFSTIVVIEYNLPSNTTMPADDDFALLEMEFVAGYNGVARRYCDPYFRRLMSAETLPDYVISEDGLTASVEMSIIGTCRGDCDDNLEIYDPRSFFVNSRVIVNDIVSNRKMQAHPHGHFRHLQSEDICYCSVVASKELGPSEPVVVQNFGELVEKLSLDSISRVSDCQPVTFERAIFLDIEGELANASQSELEQLGQTFVDSYNQASQQEGFCDKFFRKLTNVRVQRNVSIVDDFVVSGDATPDGRMLLTRMSLRTKRRAQGEETMSPTFQPTLSPTIFFNETSFNNTMVPSIVPVSAALDSLIMLVVDGSCQGCESGTNLFDQVSARRHLEEDDTTDYLTNSPTEPIDRCFCPPRTDPLELTDNQVISALSSLPFVDGVVGLEEVDIVECSVEVSTFESTVPLDFLVNGEILPEDEDFIGTGFITTYIRLSREYCDDLFRRPEEVVSSTYEVSTVNQDGTSTVRFWLNFRGICRGCTGDEALFDRNRRRMQEDEELCFCEKGAVNRAPRDEEFQEAFAAYLTTGSTGRRSLQQSKFTLLCVGQLCPQIAVAPSNAPSSAATTAPTVVLIVNPNGIQNYGGCVVPEPSFIGDGYCDRDVDANGQPIYNTAECGNDGGDCCASTCQSFRFECGLGGYWCPTDVVEEATTVVGANEFEITLCADQAGDALGNGVCDLAFNIPFCDYDNGDCCASTCGVANGLICVGPYACVNPAAVENAVTSNPTVSPSLIPSSTPTSSPSGAPSPMNSLLQTCRENPACEPSNYCGDGWCDSALNNLGCGWDGGDCCEETCASMVYTCGDGGYECQDPAHAPELPDGCVVDFPEWIGDGFCDSSRTYNSAECLFDGGDCCPHTCVGECLYFSCIQDVPDGCDVDEAGFLGDGYCDSYAPYNTAECLWDFGDCCPDTCRSSTVAICGFWTPYACFDPSSPFNETRAVVPDGCSVYDPESLGNGYCDNYGPFNSEVCGYDLGDCCAASCEAADWRQIYDCGIGGYNCLDPDFAVAKPAVPVECMVDNPDRLGDGKCDDYEFYNTAACDWDFGDCCYETCLGAEWYHPNDCGSIALNCLDPDVIRRPDVPINCKVQIPDWLGDGYCDNSAYNSEECDWDFGDCCRGTCEANEWFHWFDCGYSGYNCLDPEGNIVPPTDPPSPTVSPQPSFTPAVVIEIYGNPLRAFDVASGTYIKSNTDSLFGESVYYSESYMLYWCQSEMHWTIQLIMDVDKISRFGCKGQGLSSMPTSGPSRLCDSEWKDSAGLLLFVAAEECPLEDVLVLTPVDNVGPQLEVFGNGAYGYEFLSGTYSGSTDAVFGVGVYYFEYQDLILYWCEPSSQWYIDFLWYNSDSISDLLTTISLFGCSGIPSNTVVDGSENLCDVIGGGEEPPNFAFSAIIECPPSSTPPPVSPRPDVEVIGNGFAGYDFLSGSYVGSSDSVYGVGVYYGQNNTLYWCEDSSQWFIAWDGQVPNLNLIPVFGCAGIPSNAVRGPDVSFCDLTWENDWYSEGSVLVVVTPECPTPPVPDPVVPGPDVQAIGGLYRWLSDFSGLYRGSSTYSIFGVSIYYSENWSMIYWCGSEQRWYVTWIISVETILLFGCDGIPSNLITGSVLPGPLCEAVWEDDMGNPAFILFSSECSRVEPDPYTTNKVAPFQVVVFFDYFSACGGTYTELAMLTADAGLIFSNGACILYQAMETSEFRWELAPIFDLANITSLGSALYPLDSAYFIEEYPCRSGFWSMIICSTDCPSTHIPADPLVTIEIASQGTYQQSQTWSNGAPVWFSCFGSFKFSSSFWTFTSSGGITMFSSDTGASTDICSATWYDDIEITSCPEEALALGSLGPFNATTGTTGIVVSTTPTMTPGPSISTSPTSPTGPDATFPTTPSTPSNPPNPSNPSVSMPPTGVELPTTFTNTETDTDAATPDDPNVFPSSFPSSFPSTFPLPAPSPTPLPDPTLAPSPKTTSDPTTTSSPNPITTRTVISKFTIFPDNDYFLIVEGLENEEDAYPKEQNVTAVANVTVILGNWILASADNLSLHARTHVISFNTTVKWRGSQERLLQTEKDKRPILPDAILGVATARPSANKPPPPPPSPSSPVSRPTPIVPAPIPAPVPAPTIPAPIPAPVPGASDGADSVTTAPPTAFTGTKPPSSIFAGFSNMTSPSSSPTIELPCTSSTNGSVAFDDKYIAVKLSLTEYLEIGMSQNDTNTILNNIETAYNAVAVCEQNEAFRRINQAELVRINEIGSSSSEAEWIVRLVGECEGCIESAMSLFTTLREAENVTNQNLLDSSAGGTLGSIPYFCPGPLTSAFQSYFNLLTLPNSTGDAMLAVVELENAKYCDPLLTGAGYTPQEYTTLGSLVVSRDPSEISDADLVDLFAAFTGAVHFLSSLTYPTCDLSRKEILDVKRDPSSPSLGRRLLCDTEGRDSPPRMIQQTSADFELVVEVTFQCFGCEGRLFGATNFTASYDCLCPADTDRFGVDEREIPSPLNEALDQLSIDLSISDVIEIEAVPCFLRENVFSTIVVIDYVLPSNTTIPIDADFAVLEMEFVAGYSGVARRYCDPYFRRLLSAETLPDYVISEDGLTASVEMSIIGTCRGDCDDNLEIYDPRSFFVNSSIAVNDIVSNRKMQAHPHGHFRHLQSEDICYCSVAASKELGPSEPEVVQNFGELVDKLSLDSISKVSDCKPVTFEKAIFLNIDGELANATESELEQLGQTFVDSYNQASQQEGFCDKYFRKLTGFRVQKNVSIMDDFAVNQKTTTDGRKLLTRSFPIKRRAQGDETMSPTFPPTLSPTTFFNETSFNNTMVPSLPIPVSDSLDSLLMLVVDGSCQGCESGTNLFDQVSARRHLEEDDTTDYLTNSPTEPIDCCFCPPRTDPLELTDNQVISALSSLPFVEGVVGLEEVDIVECSVEVTTFESTVPLDFLVNGEILPEDEDFIGTGFITTYIRLSREYCDDLFRRPEEVVSSTYEVSTVNQDGTSTVRFWLNLRGICRGCTGDEALFDRNRRRLQENEELCFCEKGAVNRAPRDEEFQEAFAAYLTTGSTGRRSLQQSKFTLICVGQLCPQIAVAPSNAPSSAATTAPTGVLIVNPNGIQNYGGCVVPEPSFIGDGYCDRDLDANGQPIYNTAECGNDGGDCCASTCQSFRFECGLGGYWCPTDVVEEATTVVGANEFEITLCADQAGDALGNGVCDLAFNIPFCDYDNGDCCASTCGVANGLICVGPYACVNPTADENAATSNPTVSPSVIPSSTPTSSPSGAPSPMNSLVQSCMENPACEPSEYCGDGWCDWDLNTLECGWDGGDCCEGSCTSSALYTCGEAGYVCQDPEYVDDSGLPSTCSVDIPSWIGDGICDAYYDGYNTVNCDYDGGDCCPDTCVGECLYFSCIRDLPVGCNATETAWLGDGYCDSYFPYNTEECHWDFGDCCPDTCISTGVAVCGFWAPYVCFDPSSPFVETRPIVPDGCIVDFEEYLGDGYCDWGYENYNSAECEYDLGDCCAASCEAADWFQELDCGINGYDCLDPDFVVPRPPIPDDCLLSLQALGLDDLLGDGSCNNYGVTPAIFHINISDSSVWKSLLWIQYCIWNIYKQF